MKVNSHYLSTHAAVSCQAVFAEPCRPFFEALLVTLFITRKSIGASARFQPRVHNKGLLRLSTDDDLQLKFCRRHLLVTNIQDNTFSQGMKKNSSIFVKNSLLCHFAQVHSFVYFSMFVFFNFVRIFDEQCLQFFRPGAFVGLFKYCPFLAL